MKKFAVLFLCVITLVFSVFPAFADYTELIDSEINKTVEEGSGSYSEIKSDKVIMFNTDDAQTVVYEKNADDRADPASLTKMVVGILALRESGDPEKKVTVSQKSLDYISGTGWGVLPLYTGEKVTVKDLVYAAVMGNCNDAVVVLADEVLDGTENCVVLMNKYADTVGCDSTHFTNVNGSSEKTQYTTARDMMKIYLDCLGDPAFGDLFRQVLSAAYYDVEVFDDDGSAERRTTTTYYALTSNQFYSSSYATAGRFANTSEGKSNVVCSASYGGYNYVACVLDSPNGRRDGLVYYQAIADANNLFKWVNNNIKLKTIATKDSYCGEAQVKYSSRYDYVALCPEANITALVPVNTNDSSFVYKLKTEDGKPPVLTGSISKGDYICDAEVYYAEMKICETRLVAANDVAMNPIKVFTSSISRFVSTKFFMWVLFLFIAVVFVGIFMLIKFKKKVSQDEFMQSRSSEGSSGKDR